MLKKLDKSKKFVWIKNTQTYSEVSEETANSFDSNEQIKALMLQVKALCFHAKLDLLPVFAKQLELRDAIMKDHATRKANAEPD